MQGVAAQVCAAQPWLCVYRIRVSGRCCCGSTGSRCPAMHPASSLPSCRRRGKRSQWRALGIKSTMDGNFCGNVRFAAACGRRCSIAIRDHYSLVDFDRPTPRRAGGKQEFFCLYGGIAGLIIYSYWVMWGGLVSPYWQDVVLPSGGGPSTAIETHAGQAKSPICGRGPRLFRRRDRVRSRARSPPMGAPKDPAFADEVPLAAQSIL